MRNIFIVFVSLLLGCIWSAAQDPGPVVVTRGMAMPQAMQLPDGGGPPPNVLFQTQKSGGNVTMSYFAVGGFGKPVTGAPYSATAVTETTQVLADGNRIVNKMESQVARDGQGRTWRQETMSNIGPLATKAPKMAFINDPVAKVSYVLDLNDKTANVVKLPPPGQGPGIATARVLAPNIATSTAADEGVAIQKRVLIAGGGPGVEQRVWVNNDDASQVKTESLGTQVIEGVPATGTRTTRTIPAGEIGNERPLEITSEVWTSPDLQTVVMSKRNDPRMGETVYKLTNIQRAEPDPSLFQVPSGFTTKQGPEFSTRQIPD